MVLMLYHAQSPIYNWKQGYVLLELVAGVTNDGVMLGNRNCDVEHFHAKDMTTQVSLKVHSLAFSEYH